MTTTNEGTQRDELGQVINKALGDVTGIYDTSENEDQRLADAILAAGYRKPRTITTVEELDALPLHGVIVDDAGDGIVYRKMDLRQDGVQWFEPGYLLNWDSDEITLPATVLYEPEAEAKP